VSNEAAQVTDKENILALDYQEIKMDDINLAIFCQIEKH
jgi:hypothetical protein